MKNLPSNIWGTKLFFILAVACFCLAGAVTGFASEGGEAAGHADWALRLKDFGWRTLNFTLLVAILGWGVAKMDIKSLLAARQKSVEKSIREAAEEREAAEKKFVEYSEKLDKASSEIDDIHASIKLEAELEKKRILEDAALSAKRIIELSAAAADQEIQKARMALREEAARLSVQLAARTLKDIITKNDQDRFVNEFIDDYNTKVEKRN
ncbi:MAG: ATP synthase F0 subunit B [Deltaproteobacteria bacterium]